MNTYWTNRLVHFVRWVLLVDVLLATAVAFEFMSFTFWSFPTSPRGGTVAMELVGFGAAALIWWLAKLWRQALTQHLTQLLRSTIISLAYLFLIAGLLVNMVMIFSTFFDVQLSITASSIFGYAIIGLGIVVMVLTITASRHWRHIPDLDSVKNKMPKTLWWRRIGLAVISTAVMMQLTHTRIQWVTDVPDRFGWPLVYMERGCYFSFPLHCVNQFHPWALVGNIAIFTILSLVLSWFVIKPRTNQAAVTPRVGDTLIG